MHILQAGIGVQNVVFVPTTTFDGVTILKLKNEINSTEESYATFPGYLGTLTKYANYYSWAYNFTDTIENGYTYILEFIDNADNVLYRGKLFVTDSTNLNNDTYEPRTTTNDFVIL